MALDGTRRSLDGSSNGNGDALGARFGSMEQALRSRCRVGARYGNRGSRDIGSRRKTVTGVRHVAVRPPKSVYCSELYQNYPSEDMAGTQTAPTTTTRKNHAAPYFTSMSS